MRILVTSDLHGLDSAYERFVTVLERGQFNLGLLCGDLLDYPSYDELRSARVFLASEGRIDQGDATKTILWTQQRALQQMERYYKSILLRARKPIIFIMGNDDGIIGSATEWTSDRYVISANQKRLNYGKYNIVGYQYTNPFVGGTFEKPEAEQELDLRNMEKLIDTNTILISHGPAWGRLDTLKDGRHVGSKVLGAMLKRKPVKFHLFGHIHGAFGQQGNAVNVAYPFAQKFIGVDVDSDTVMAIE
jgi:Icc-related predicted phosphoesterase